ncbi:hypothetical protein M3Y99_00597100 [Aphelenchoides fujianensis]|nr:hypothetical protein M3Y99_00597100 [Aphelenchoides fujianensis]
MTSPLPNGPPPPLGGFQPPGASVGDAAKASIYAPVYSPLISALLAHIGHKPPPLQAPLQPLQLPPVQPPPPLQQPPPECLAVVLMPAFVNQTALPIRIKILVEGLLDQRLNNTAAERAAVCSVLHAAKWSEADVRRGFVHVDPLTGRAPASIRTIGVAAELAVLRSIGMMLPSLQFFAGSLCHSLVATVSGAELSLLTRSAAHSPSMFPHTQQSSGAMNHGHSTIQSSNSPANDTPASTPPSERPFSGPLVPTVAAAVEEKPPVLKLKGDPAKATKRVQCAICDGSFCDKGALKIHHSAVHVKDQHKCIVPGCTRTFSSRRSRNRHSSNTNLHQRNGLQQTVGQVLAELVPKCRERIPGGWKYLLPTHAAIGTPSSVSSSQSSDVSSSSAASSSKTDSQLTSESDECNTAASSSQEQTEAADQDIEVDVESTTIELECHETM